MTAKDRQALKQLLERLSKKYEAEWYYKFIIHGVKKPGRQEWRVRQDWSTGFVKAELTLARLAQLKKKS